MFENAKTARKRARDRAALATCTALHNQNNTAPRPTSILLDAGTLSFNCPGPSTLFCDPYGTAPAAPAGRPIFSPALYCRAGLLPGSPSPSSASLPDAHLLLCPPRQTQPNSHTAKLCRHPTPADTDPLQTRSSDDRRHCCEQCLTFARRDGGGSHDQLKRPPQRESASGWRGRDYRATLQACRRASLPPHDAP